MGGGGNYIRSCARSLWDNVIVISKKKGFESMSDFFLTRNQLIWNVRKSFVCAKFCN